MHYPEPYRIKVIEPLRRISLTERQQALAEAGYNVHALGQSQVYLDFGSTRSPQAMNERQWRAWTEDDRPDGGAFDELEEAVQQVLEQAWVVPVHSARGAEHLLMRHLLKTGNVVLTNGNLEGLSPLAAALGARVEDVLSRDPGMFLGNFDLERTERLLREESVAMVVATASVSLLGGQVLSLGNLGQVAELCEKARVKLVLDASRLGSAAYFAREMEERREPLGEVIKRYSNLADVIYLSGRDDCMGRTGGLVAGLSRFLLDSLRELVALYDGLPGHGGQSEQDMRALACGLKELSLPAFHHFRRRKFDHLVRRLQEAGLPLYGQTGTDGVAIHAGRVLEGEGVAAPALAAATYLSSGVRVATPAAIYPDYPDLLVLRIPRRSYTEAQLDFALEALTRLPAVERFQLAPGEYGGIEDAVFQASTLEAKELEARPEPFMARVVEPLRQVSRARREEALEAAGYNTCLLDPADVYLDLQTDAGTAAMSAVQWAARFQGTDSEGKPRAFEALSHTMRQLFGFPHVVAVPNGQAAEHVLARAVMRPKQKVINNLYSASIREHYLEAGGSSIVCIRKEALSPALDFAFKGDLDPAKVEAVILREGASKVACITLEAGVGMAGGQPISLEGTRKIAAIARAHGVPLYFVGSRLADNAYSIQQHEKGQKRKSLQRIVHELMSLGDGCVLCAGKDLLSPAGGVVLLRDPAIHRQASAVARAVLGPQGVAARDLLAMAQGAVEMMDEEDVRVRAQLVRYLGDLLEKRGIPIVRPVAGHAVYLDARRFLPHIPQSEFPAQRLAAELYLEAGVRGMERGLVSAGRSRKTREHNPSPFELVKLAVPRRVYTRSHLELVAAAIERVWRRREEISGLEIFYEAPTLRFLQTRFRPMEEVRANSQSGP